jgi:hydrogenase-4 membrane subunit HyfE
VNPLLIAFVAVLLVPLFVASWRLSLAGLAAQAMLMTSISYQLDPRFDSATAWFELFDLLIVRGFAAPLALYTVLLSQRASPRNDVIPPNLMSWTLAIVFVIGGFRFADMLVPAEGAEHGFVAVASAALLLGLLVLATQTGPFSQMVGVLRIENAIALLELSGKRDDDNLAMTIAQTAILIGTIMLFRWYLRTLPRTSVAKMSAVEGMDG